MLQDALLDQNSFCAHSGRCYKHINYHSYVPQYRESEQVVIEDRIEKENLRKMLEKEQMQRDAATKVMAPPVQPRKSTIAYTNNY